jgi:hypothetical protein
VGKAPASSLGAPEVCICRRCHLRSVTNVDPVALAVAVIESLHHPSESNTAEVEGVDQVGYAGIQQGEV